MGSPKNSFLRRLESLKKNPLVQEFLKTNPLPKLTIKEYFFLLTLVSLGQKHLFAEDLKKGSPLLKLKTMLSPLDQIEKFYKSVGGIAGYHKTFLDLVSDEMAHREHFLKPKFFNIKKLTPKVQEMVELGIKSLKDTAFIFPMGGAGDRLNLFDKRNNKPLPAAKLPFLGKTLLSLLMEDVAALEELYFKRFNTRLTIPIVIMTSYEKNNHEEIVKIFRKNSWFQRPATSIFFVKQFSVPMISKEGLWALEEPLKLFLKPGGHGFLWHLMHEEAAFQWLKRQNISKAIVRQINNPIASQDYGILALLGYGVHNKKAMGFASCPRVVHSAEGMLVLKEKSGVHYTISNIEYTDFKKLSIEDRPIRKNSRYSEYPTNTNLLFVDLKSVQKAIKKNLFPGKTINFKNSDVGRIEVMMQNIADYIISPKEKLKTFLTYNERVKTISCTKKPCRDSSSLLETPEGCFLDLLRNNYSLLKKFCEVKLPRVPKEEKYIKQGLSFIAILHPSIGPLYTDIALKIRRGTIARGGEIQLEIKDILLQDFQLKGSAVIKGTLGKCILEDVKIENRGIDWKWKNSFWQNRIKRKELFKIVLHGRSEFIAKNVTFKGSFNIEVQDGERILAFEEDGKIAFKRDKLFF